MGEPDWACGPCHTMMGEAQGCKTPKWEGQIFLQQGNDKMFLEGDPAKAGQSLVIHLSVYPIVPLAIISWNSFLTLFLLVPQLHPPFLLDHHASQGLWPCFVWLLTHHEGHLREGG